VVQVTWEQAALFCNWLSAKDSLPSVYEKSGSGVIVAKPTGAGYRLPTEAEWEFCARLRDNRVTAKYPWGEGFPPPDRAGNFADRSARDLLAATLKGYNDDYPVSAPTGQFTASPQGLFDLAGNVAEWCQDYYSIYSYKPDQVTVNPTGPAEGRHRIVRGSSFKHAGISELRSAYRDYSDDKRDDLGFRVCRYAE
jgi:formylglycine-generating enzyme required for sulfatase activity